MRANKYRYNYGRQANRTLKDILIPDVKDIPSWVNIVDVDVFDEKDRPLINKETPTLTTSSWKSFKLSELFDLKKGKRLTRAQMKPGETPFIGAIDKNNGLTAFVKQIALHPGNTITVNYNGNGVAEAFYQPIPFRCSDDVNVLYPKFKLTPETALFIATIIRQEKYRFNYGRKWHLERMEQSEIKLPVDSRGTPDWDFMEMYIKTIAFSSSIVDNWTFAKSGGGCHRW